MRTKIYLWLLTAWLVFGSGRLPAQQVMLYQQSPVDMYVINPAFAGYDENIHLNLCYLKQYAGITKSPQSYYFNVYSRLGKRPAKVYKQYSLRISQPGKYSTVGKPKASKIIHGTGAFISNDAYGQMKKLNTGLSYSLHYRLNEKNTAAIGLSAGLVNFSFNKDGLIPDIPLDETLQQFINQNYSTSFINLNGGILLYSSKWMISYSAHQILGNQIWLRSESNPYQIQLHHFLSAQYKMSIKQGKLKLNPGLIVRYLKGIDPLVELNTLLYTDRYWGGIAYRLNNSALLMFGIKWNKINVGYSYSLNTNVLFNNTAGSHELLLGMTF